MASSISGFAAAQLASPYAAPTTAIVNPPQQPQDSVTLSESAQVSQLSTQGQSATEISQNLGIPVATVDSDLGIVVASVAPTIKAAPAPAHAVHSAPVAPPKAASVSSAK
jgi:hypothetical protein